MFKNFTLYHYVNFIVGGTGIGCGLFALGLLFNALWFATSVPWQTFASSMYMCVICAGLTYMHVLGKRNGERMTRQHRVKI